MYSANRIFLILLICVVISNNGAGNKPESGRDASNVTEGICGIVKKKGLTRIANPEQSNEHYPWVILVERKFKGNYGERLVGECGGSIITERFVFKRVYSYVVPDNLLLKL